MTTTDTQSSHRRGAANQRVELGRYTITTGERIVFGQRVLGVVRLVDVAADGRGRRYVIERGLSWMAELKAIVADYLQQAGFLDAVPAARPCGLVDEIEAMLR